jgi:hypothetical protein
MNVRSFLKKAGLILLVVILVLILATIFAQKANGQTCSPEQSQRQAAYYLPVVSTGVQTSPDGTSAARWRSEVFITANLGYGIGSVAVDFFSMEKGDACPLFASYTNGAWQYNELLSGIIAPIAANGQLYFNLSAPNDDSWNPMKAPVRCCDARIKLQEVCVGGEWVPSYKPRIVYRMEDRDGMTIASAGELASKPAQEIFIPATVDANTDTDGGILNTDDVYSNTVTFTLYSVKGDKIAEKNFVLGPAELRVFFLSELFSAELGNMGGVLKAGILRVKGEKPVAGTGLVARREPGAAGAFAISGNPFAAYGK